MKCTHSGEDKLSLKNVKGSGLVIFIIALFIILVVAIVAIFSVQNATPVAVWLFNWQFNASLAIVIFLAVLTGMLIASMFFVSLRIRKSLTKKGREAKRNEKVGESALPR
ncbi:MAG: hypothetical protein A4E57_02693 [Syntrophorhabdaceae bacterium PtaU1.Bin034]|nr:MAG: hypothetical protein A4E57_02693 [Syntrophorhabdaceae bacterium PtaU1.Bin034]